MIAGGGEGDSPRIYVLPPLLYLGCFALGGLVDRFRPWALPDEGAAAVGLRGLGVVFVLGGLALDLWSVGLFRRAGTSPLPFRPASAIVAAGPYRFTRNPMYLGMTLLLAGVGLLLGRGWIALSALLAAAIVDRFVIPREERYLERTFGDAYLAYKRQARRWI